MSNNADKTAMDLKTIFPVVYFSILAILNGIVNINDNNTCPFPVGIIGFIFWGSFYIYCLIGAIAAFKRSSIAFKILAIVLFVVTFFATTNFTINTPDGWYMALAQITVFAGLLLMNLDFRQKIAVPVYASGIALTIVYILSLFKTHFFTAILMVVPALLYLILFYALFVKPSHVVGVNTKLLRTLNDSYLNSLLDKFERSKGNYKHTTRLRENAKEAKKDAEDAIAHGSRHDDLKYIKENIKLRDKAISDAIHYNKLSESHDKKQDFYATQIIEYYYQNLSVAATKAKSKK